ncbi:hypothetical protein BJ508DRAFT_343873 [Ascobolus immersus RN42]|uniref:Uncharacterized protein n=1 Tax=Ascobolus immersus RN42 TaxID=1160509 RepID=A0A3N4IM76_ASCIM|nr:hypothetical protein BJ508DRAFT_343873 [Ascobolus immersus RN42]
MINHFILPLDFRQKNTKQYNTSTSSTMLFTTGFLSIFTLWAITANALPGGRPIESSQDTPSTNGKKYAIIDNPLVHNANCLDHMKEFHSVSASPPSLFTTDSPCSLTPIDDNDAGSIEASTLRGYLVCTTNEWSPEYNHLKTLIAKMKTRSGTMACLAEPKRWTPMLAYKTAVISYLSDAATPEPYNCEALASFANAVAERCQQAYLEGPIVVAGEVIIKSPFPFGVVKVSRTPE